VDENMYSLSDINSMSGEVFFHGRDLRTQEGWWPFAVNYYAEKNKVVTRDQETRVAHHVDQGLGRTRPKRLSQLPQRHYFLDFEVTRATGVPVYRRVRS